MAIFISKKLRDLDKKIEVNLEDELKASENECRVYHNDYIKKEGLPRLPLWQIAANRIKRDRLSFKEQFLPFLFPIIPEQG